MKLSLFFKNCCTCFGEPIPLQVSQDFFNDNAIILIFLVNAVDMLGSSRHKVLLVPFRGGSRKSERDDRDTYQI